MRKKKKKEEWEKKKKSFLEDAVVSGFEQFDLEKALMEFLGEEETPEKESGVYFPLDKGGALSNKEEKQDVMEKLFFEDVKKTEGKQNSDFDFLEQQEKEEKSFLGNPMYFQMEKEHFEERTLMDMKKRQEEKVQFPINELQNRRAQQDFLAVEEMGISPRKVEGIFSGNREQPFKTEIQGLHEISFTEERNEKKFGWQPETMMTEKENLKPILDEIKEMISGIITKKDAAFQDFAQEKIENPIFS